MRTLINAYRKVFKTVTFRSLIINIGHIKNVCVVDRSSPLCVFRTRSYEYCKIIFRSPARHNKKVAGFVPDGIIEIFH